MAEKEKLMSKEYVFFAEFDKLHCIDFKKQRSGNGMARVRGRTRKGTLKKGGYSANPVFPEKWGMVTNKRRRIDFSDI